MIEPKITANIEKATYPFNDIYSNYLEDSLFRKSWLKNFNLVFNYRNQVKFLLVKDEDTFKLVVVNDDLCYVGDAPANRFVIEEEIIEGVYVKPSLFYCRKDKEEAFKKKEAELAALEKRIAELKKEVNQI